MRITDEVKQLRAAVGVLTRGRGRKYPAELRGRILAWVDGEVARGTSETECAEALGMPMHRFEVWRDRERELEQVPAEFVPIEVSAPLSGGLVLSTPSGYRIEGLTVAQAIAVLKALR